MERIIFEKFISVKFINERNGGNVPILLQLVYKFRYPFERHKKKGGGKKASSSKKRSFRIHFIHVSCLLDSLAAFLRPRFLQFSDVDRDFSRTDATVEQRSIHACHCLD